MTLTREMRRELSRWLWPRLLIPIAMAVGTLGLMFLEQLEISRAIERDTIRSELSDLDHRIKQERCVIEPINQVIRQRIEAETAEPRFRLCNPDEAIADLQARHEQLEKRLRDMGAFELRARSR